MRSGWLTLTSRHLKSFVKPWNGRPFFVMCLLVLRYTTNYSIAWVLHDWLRGICINYERNSEIIVKFAYRIMLLIPTLKPTRNTSAWNVSIICLCVIVLICVESCLNYLSGRKKINISSFPTTLQTSDALKLLWRWWLVCFWFYWEVFVGLSNADWL